MGSSSYNIGNDEVAAIAVSPPSPEGVFVPTLELHELYQAVEQTTELLGRLLKGEPIERAYIMHLYQWLPTTAANISPKKYAETIA